LTLLLALFALDGALALMLFLFLRGLALAHRGSLPAVPGSHLA
jgi:hypothetical protein